MIYKIVRLIECNSFIKFNKFILFIFILMKMFIEFMKLVMFIFHALFLTLVKFHLHGFLSDFIGLLI